MKPGQSPFKASGPEFLSVVIKALAALPHLPVADRFAMASVLTVMAGAPLHVSTDDILERALTVMPMFQEILKETMTGDVIYLPSGVDRLFHEFYKRSDASAKYRKRVQAALALYATIS